MDRTRFSQIVICAAVILPALMLGTVHSEALGVTLLFAAFLFGAVALHPPIKIDLGGAIFLALIAFTGLQMLPLPATLIQTLSPVSFEIQQHAMAALREPTPQWMTLTVDLPHTTEELAKLLFYLGLYWSVKTVARTHGNEYLLTAITVVGVLGAVILMAHKIAMFDQIYGVYTPVHRRISHRVSAPFINENHMAAFLSLCSFVSIGLAIRARDRSKRLMFIAVSAIIGGALLLTLSRGGIAAYVGGQLLFISMLTLRSLLQKKNSNTRNLTLTWLPLGLAFSLGLGMLAAQDAIIGEYINQDTQKIGIFSQSLPLMQQFPLFGAGRGGFGLVFPQVSDWASRATFTHAENIVVQLLVDYGLPMGCFALVGFIAVVVRRLISAPMRPIGAALFAALVACAIQNLVDFNLEFPGVTAVAVSLLAVLTSSQRKTPIRHPHWRFPVPKPLHWGLAVASLVLSGFLLINLPARHIENVREQAQTELSVRNSSFFARNHLHKMLADHPASAYLPFYAGLYYFHHPKDVAPLPLFAHAVRQNPYAGAPHYYIGRVLLDSGYIDQAMLEFRLAARNDATFARFGAVALIHRYPQFDKLKSWPTTQEDKRLLYEALAAEFASRGLDNQAKLADKRLLQLKVPTPGALTRHARRIASTDLASAKRLAHQLRFMPGYEINGILLTADIYSIAKVPQKAIQVLEAAPKIAQNDYRYLRQLATLYQQVGEHQRAIKTAQRLRQQADSTTMRAQAVEFEGDLEARQGNNHSAKARYKQALAMVPDNVRFLVKLLGSAQRTQDIDTEINTLKRLAQLQPQEKKWRTLLENHKAKIIPPEI